MFNRDEFKPSSVSSLEGEDKKVDKLLGRDRGNSNYLRIEPGRNIFRIFPPHPSKTPNLFIEARVTSQLPFLVEEKDDRGEVVMENGRPKMVERTKHVFNGKVHGGLPFDIVEEYISRVIEKSKKMFTERSKEQTNFLRFIYGAYNPKNKAENLFGINYSQKWVMYVKKILDVEKETFEYGRLEVGKAVKNRLNEIAAIESQNQAITTDPFSHPDEGITITITYNSQADSPQDFYKTDLFMPRQGNNIRLFPLTDEDLNWLITQESLATQFQNCFKRKDLDLQIQGLERLDQKSGYGIFNDPSFIKQIEQILLLVPEDKTTDTNTETENKQSPIQAESTTTPPVVEKEVVQQKVEVNPPVVENKLPEPEVVIDQEEMTVEQRVAMMKAKFLNKPA